jgi:outer membrane protein assembly factor BamB
VNFSNLWSNTTKGGFSSAVWPYQNLILIGNSLGQLEQVYINDGKTQSQLDVMGPVVSSPVIYRNWAYFGTGNGFFYAVNMTDMSDYYLFEQPRVALDQAFTSSPAICDQDGANVVVVGGNDGTVFGFTLR